MGTSTRFRLNQYNWFGQKLLAQHRYDELLQVRRHLAGGIDAAAQLELVEEPLIQVDSNKFEDQGVVSDHMNYLTGLALMKTRGNLSTALVDTLQKLNYQKNGQYFLLLCQCLLYLGNHDSVVAICKQVLNREIDTTSLVQDTSGLDVETNDIQVDQGRDSTGRDKTSKLQLSKQQEWLLKSICEESLEFKSMVDSVNKNRLINDPRLWFIFALCLEFQSQLKDADLAFRVASKLTSGQARQITSAGRLAHDSDRDTSDDLNNHGDLDSAAVSDYYEPYTRYAEFCLQFRDDYKTAIQVLNQATSVHSAPINYDLMPTFAATLCSQPQVNASMFARAIEIVQALDSHAASTRNPSSVYNQIALKCKQKLHRLASSLNEITSDINAISHTIDERRSGLDYVLMKSFVLINDVVHKFCNDTTLFKSPLAQGSGGQPVSNTGNQIQAQIDKVIGTLRSCDSSCWPSHSLWNNLGICYLIKRRYVTSLSCLTKALQLNPLDWRINYNIALVYQHVNASLRSLICSLAAKDFHVGQIDKFSISSSSLVSTMLASCYSGLGMRSEARRYYAEMLASSRRNASSRAPVMAIVNYLLFLHQHDGTDAADENNNKLIIRLLDQLEQEWLQRNPNDIQFVPNHLEIAKQIGYAQQGSRPQMQKSYAWTKYT